MKTGAIRYFLCSTDEAGEVCSGRGFEDFDCVLYCCATEYKGIPMSIVVDGTTVACITALCSKGSCFWVLESAKAVGVAPAANFRSSGRHDARSDSFISLRLAGHEIGENDLRVTERADASTNRLLDILR